jgi:hypothetical protein
MTQPARELIVLGSLNSPLAVSATGIVAASRTYLPERFQVVEFGVCFVVHAGSDACVADLRFRPTPGSATGEVVVTTLTTVASPTVLSVTYKRRCDVACAKGGELHVNVTDAGPVSSTALFYIKGYWQGAPNVEANESLLTA